MKPNRCLQFDGYSRGDDTGSIWSQNSIGSSGGGVLKHSATVPSDDGSVYSFSTQGDDNMQAHAHSICRSLDSLEIKMYDRLSDAPLWMGWMNGCNDFTLPHPEWC